MEFKVYFNILKKKWWIIVIVFAVVVAGTWFWTARQTPIYEAKTTFVIRPRSEFVVEDEFVRTLDLVSRRVEINTTFAEVVGSKLIKKQAIDSLQLSTAERQDLSVSGRVIGGTNILEITAQGPDPVIVSNFANAVGEQAVEFVKNLYDVFELEPLDPATIPTGPVKPRPVLNLALGAVLGLALGSGLAFLLAYLEMPTQEQNTFNILDRETGAYNKAYLMHRLGQEMGRSKRTKIPLSLGLLTLDLSDRSEDNAYRHLIEALRMTRVMVEAVVRPEDILARYDKESFAILLPDMNERQARAFMEELRLRIGSVPEDAGGGMQLKSSVKAVAYENYRMNQTRFLEQTIQTFAEGPMTSQDGNHTNEFAPSNGITAEKPYPTHHN